MPAGNREAKRNQQVWCALQYMLSRRQICRGASLVTGMQALDVHHRAFGSSLLGYPQNVCASSAAAQYLGAGSPAPSQISRAGQATLQVEPFRTASFGSRRKTKRFSSTGSFGAVHVLFTPVLSPRPRTSNDSPPFSKASLGVDADVSPKSGSYR